MKSLKSILFIVFALFAFTSCSEYSEFNEDAFESSSWTKTTGIEFNPVISSTGDYQAFIQLRYIDGLQFQQIDAMAAVTSPAGTTDSIPFAFVLKNADGTSVADCAGDYCDLEMPFNYSFNEKGNYKVVVTYTMDMDGLGGVMGMGIDIRKK
ncbi:MAG: hypothetical protein CVU05_03750 [Bacteroidetes bacterium HGW-Bacteroidetes-21]|jgi:gliding motility-associated lipoprotein GldH|nr:MAG: hypothetical protein CVU05_03750 [Bacteroidetes bacterium HGW-Bacteroidetes-21]